MLMSPMLTGLSISSSIVVSVLEAVELVSESNPPLPLLEQAAREIAVAPAITPARILLKFILKNLLNVMRAIVYTHSLH